MQLHVHSQIAHIVRTGTDGKWRVPNSLGYNDHIGALGAIVAQHLEGALTRRFGVEWVARDDGHGFEIKGISRGDDARVLLAPRAITAGLRERAERFEQRFNACAVAAGTGAGVELQYPRGQGRHAGSRATTHGLGGQARAHARRPAGVGRTVGAARGRARAERLSVERA